MNTLQRLVLAIESAPTLHDSHVLSRASSEVFKTAALPPSVMRALEGQQFHRPSLSTHPKLSGIAALPGSDQAAVTTAVRDYARFLLESPAELCQFLELDPWQVSVELRTPSESVERLQRLFLMDAALMEMWREAVLLELYNIRSLTRKFYNAFAQAAVITRRTV